MDCSGTHYLFQTVTSHAYMYTAIVTDNESTRNSVNGWNSWHESGFTCTITIISGDHRLCGVQDTAASVYHAAPYSYQRRHTVPHLNAKRNARYCWTQHKLSSNNDSYSGIVTSVKCLRSRTSMSTLDLTPLRARQSSQGSIVGTAGNPCSTN